MHNLQAQANREFAIRQGVMRDLDEGTGSVFVEGQSAPFQGVSRVWMMLNPDMPYSHASHSATTGSCIVMIMNQISPLEVLVEMNSNFETALSPVVLSPALILDCVRDVFGLNISETAEVFGVTRQTAYQWMKLTDIEQVRSSDNRERIKQLYRAAQFWQARPPLKGRWLHALFASGNTVFDLLKKPQLDLDELQNAYMSLATGTIERQREEGERATHAAAALTNAFEGLGAGRKARRSR